MFLFTFPLQLGDHDGRRQHMARVVEAIRDTAEIRTEQRACELMALNQAQWNRQKAGDGHLSYSRLALLPAEFWRLLGLYIVRDMGVPAIVKMGIEAQKAAAQVRVRRAAARTERRTA